MVNVYFQRLEVELRKPSRRSDALTRGESMHFTKSRDVCQAVTLIRFPLYSGVDSSVCHL